MHQFRIEPVGTELFTDSLWHGNPPDPRRALRRREFIVNPIVGVGFGRNGTADFSPAARLAYKLSDDLLPGGSKGASERTTSTSPVNPMSRANLTSLH